MVSETDDGPGSHRFSCSLLKCYCLFLSIFQLVATRGLGEWHLPAINSYYPFNGQNGH